MPEPERIASDHDDASDTGAISIKTTASLVAALTSPTLASQLLEKAIAGSIEDFKSLVAHLVADKKEIAKRVAIGENLHLATPDYYDRTFGFCVSHIRKPVEDSDSHLVWVAYSLTALDALWLGNRKQLFARPSLEETYTQIGMKFGMLWTDIFRWLQVLEVNARSETPTIDRDLSVSSIAAVFTLYRDINVRYLDPIFEDPEVIKLTFRLWLSDSLAKSGSPTLLSEPLAIMTILPRGKREGDEIKKTPTPFVDQLSELYHEMGNDEYQNGEVAHIAIDRLVAILDKNANDARPTMYALNTLWFLTKENDQHGNKKEVLRHPGGFSSVVRGLNAIANNFSPFDTTERTDAIERGLNLIQTQLAADDSDDARCEGFLRNGLISMMHNLSKSFIRDSDRQTQSAFSIFLDIQYRLRKERGASIRAALIDDVRKLPADCDVNLESISGFYNLLKEMVLEEGVDMSRFVPEITYSEKKQPVVVEKERIDRESSWKISTPRQFEQTDGSKDEGENENKMCVDSSKGGSEESSDEDSGDDGDKGSGDEVKNNREEDDGGGDGDGDNSQIKISQALPGPRPDPQLTQELNDAIAGDFGSFQSLIENLMIDKKELKHGEESRFPSGEKVRAFKLFVSHVRRPVKRSRLIWVANSMIGLEALWIGETNPPFWEKLPDQHTSPPNLHMRLGVLWTDLFRWVLALDADAHSNSPKLPKSFSVAAISVIYRLYRDISSFHLNPIFQDPEVIKLAFKLWLLDESGDAGSLQSQPMEIVSTLQLDFREKNTSLLNAVMEVYHQHFEGGSNGEVACIAIERLDRVLEIDKVKTFERGANRIRLALNTLWSIVRSEDMYGNKKQVCLHAKGPSSIIKALTAIADCVLATKSQRDDALHRGLDIIQGQFESGNVKHMSLFLKKGLLTMLHKVGRTFLPQDENQVQAILVILNHVYNALFESSAARTKEAALKDARKLPVDIRRELHVENIVLLLEEIRLIVVDGRVQNKRLNFAVLSRESLPN